MSTYLRVKNWGRFQQYKDREPKWIKVDDVNALSARYSAYVYLIYRNKDLVYVGRTTRAKPRLQAHVRSGRFTGCVFQIREFEDSLVMDYVEQSLIANLRPSENRLIYREENIRRPSGVIE
jgi:hypothetical protein